DAAFVFIDDGSAYARASASVQSFVDSLPGRDGDRHIGDHAAGINRGKVVLAGRSGDRESSLRIGEYGIECRSGRHRRESSPPSSKLHGWSEANFGVGERELRFCIA